MINCALPLTRLTVFEKSPVLSSAVGTLYTLSSGVLSRRPSNVEKKNVLFLPL